MPRLSPTAAASAAVAAISGAGVFYLGLFVTDPGTTGDVGEVSGAGYARQAITFDSAPGGVQSSTNAQSFTNLPNLPSGVPFFGIFNAPTGGAGTYRLGGVTEGGSNPIPAGSSISVVVGGVVNTWG